MCEVIAMTKASDTLIAQLRNERVGMTNKASNGQLMEIIDYAGSRNLTIRFDDGTIVSGITYRCFLNGHVKNPNFIHPYLCTRTGRIGEQVVNKEGLLMTLVAYTSCNDVTIRFEDGVEIHRSYARFKNGIAQHPDSPSRNVSNMSKYIGKTITAKNGQQMTVVGGRSCKDLDILFEDGTKVSGIPYNRFIIGAVANPNYNPYDRTGDTNIATNGMKMFVKEYRHSFDIDVEFEDGYVAEHQQIYAFYRGHIKHLLPYQMGDMLIKKSAYIHYDCTNFYCTCTKCGFSDIMTIQEMREHKCQNS